MVRAAVSLSVMVPVAVSVSVTSGDEAVKETVKVSLPSRLASSRCGDRELLGLAGRTDEIEGLGRVIKVGRVGGDIAVAGVHGKGAGHGIVQGHGEEQSGAFDLGHILYGEGGRIVVGDGAGGGIGVGDQRGRGGQRDREGLVAFQAGIVRCGDRELLGLAGRTDEIEGLGRVIKVGRVGGDIAVAGVHGKGAGHGIVQAHGEEQSGAFDLGHILYGEGGRIVVGDGAGGGIGVGDQRGRGGQRDREGLVAFQAGIVELW